MQLTSLITAAGLAAVTNAFLLPPEVSVSDNDIVSTLPVPINADVRIPKIAEVQNVKLKCPGCPVRIPHHGEVKIISDIPSHLELDFSVEPSDGADRLMLNGFELYPNADPFRNSLTAAVRPDLKKKPHHFKGRRPQAVQTLGFGLHTRPVAKNEDELELIEVELDIIEVGDVFVEGIPNVQVQLIKTPGGKLAILAIVTTDPKTMQTTPMDKQAECTTMLCKWKAIIMQKLSGLRFHKGCGGRPAHVKGHGQVNDQAKAEEPHGHHHEHPEHHEHHQKNWGLLFKNIASHILLPVAVGILAGVTACILGMMAGTFVVFLWRLVARRGRTRRHHRHGHHHKASRAEVAVEDEKSGLMAHQEEVDVAPPAYVEEGVVVADDKKTENVA